MRVAFRVDASVEIGAGHLMRCLTLANALREDGANCEFVCRTHRGHLARKVEEAGHRVHLLSALSNDSNDMGPAGPTHAPWLGCSWQRDAGETIAILDEARYDWLVVDHYALDARWELELQSNANRIMVIDDLADRRHACDLLLDQGMGRTALDYAMLISPTTRCLMGPEYALLRPGFSALREYSMSRREGSPWKRILVSLGGFDRNNVTGRVLDVLARFDMPDGVNVSVVMGQHSPSLESVVDQAARMPFFCEVRVDVDDMARIMAESDIAIGAAGGSAWERCALGLPSIVLVLAENQSSTATSIDEARAAIILPTMDAWTAADLNAAIQQLTTIEVREAYSRSASRLVDGCGTFRVKAAMESAQ